MNWVFENLVQGALGGYEDILLKFRSQIIRDNFHRTKEPSNIWEDDLPGDSIIETLDFKERCPSDFTQKIPKFQEDQYEYSSEEFISCYEYIFPSPPVPTRVVQHTIKGEGIQGKKWLHRIPLNLQGEVHSLPDISMDKFPIFFRNTLEDA
jgi:hypothetical protein